MYARIRQSKKFRKLYNKMKAAVKEQTAFRFDAEIITQMKRRAKSLNMSVNRYVTGLIEKDLRESLTLPKVKLPLSLDEDVAWASGVLREPDESELMSDERLRNIWER